MKPPRTPAENLRRVIRVAKIDGLSVVIVAGLCLLITAALGDGMGMVVVLLIACAGAAELRGASLLKSLRPEGLRWAVASQLLLLAVVLGYVLLRITHPETDPILNSKVLTDAITLAKQMNPEADASTFDLRWIVRLAYLAVAALTVIYQGGMALYYLGRRPHVEAAVLAAAAD